MRQYIYVDRYGNKYKVKGKEFKKLREALIYAQTYGREIKIRYEDGTCL